MIRHWVGILSVASVVACALSDSDASQDGNCSGKCDSLGDLGEDQDYRDGPGVEACATAIQAIPAEAIHAELRIDSNHGNAVTQAVRTCLSEYIQRNTSNPRREDEPGETAAAHFFAGIFQRLDVPFQFTTMAGDRDLDRLGIVATLAGQERDDSILLLSHTDVVRAEGDWEQPPFSGFDDGKYVWGRGALDMKIISILQLISMGMIQHSGIDTQRDIHFVAVPDEEVLGSGAEFVALTDRDENGNPVGLDPLNLNPGVVLNEGGTAIADALLPGRDVFLIATEEKGLSWMQLASSDPLDLLGALVQSAVAAPPDPTGLPPVQTRAELQERCSLESMISDEEQKTNVQPQVATVALRCDTKSASLVREALEPLESAFTPEPTLTIESQRAGTDDIVTIGIAQGGGGHGSASTAANALDVALAVLVATGQLDENSLVPDEAFAEQLFGFALSPANKVLVRALARVVGPVTGRLVGWLAEQDFIIGKAGAHASHLLPSSAPFQNTCSFTAFDFPVHNEARAKLDCRLIHGRTAQQLEQELLAHMTAKHDVELRRGPEDCYDCARQEFSASPTDNPDYQILRTVAERSSPSVVVTPYLFPASSDTFFFRFAGVPTYGFMSASLPEELLLTFHAVNERFPIDQMWIAQKTYAEALLQMVTRIAPSPADQAHRLDQHIQCFEWDEDFLGDDEWEPRKEIECSLNPRTYYCEASPETPRYIRARAEDQDVRLYRVDRLASVFDNHSPPPSGAGSNAVESVLFRPRNGGKLKHRLFEGSEFEIDTGTATTRRFLIECSLPPTLNPLDDAELQFYRD